LLSISIWIILKKVVFLFFIKRGINSVQLFIYCNRVWTNTLKFQLKFKVYILLLPIVILRRCLQILFEIRYDPLLSHSLYLYKRILDAYSNVWNIEVTKAQISLTTARGFLSINSALTRSTTNPLQSPMTSGYLLQPCDWSCIQQPGKARHNESQFVLSRRCW